MSPLPKSPFSVAMAEISLKCSVEFGYWRVSILLRAMRNDNTTHASIELQVRVGSNLQWC